MPLKTHTHNGPPHADEATAVAIVFEAYPGSTVTRSRNPADHDAADLVIDEGGKFDGVKFLDHHPPLKVERRPNGVPYAAAGLTLRRIGPVWVEPMATANGFSVEAVIARVDELFIQAIDAKDNGDIALSATLDVKDPIAKAALPDPDVSLSTNDLNSLIRLFTTTSFSDDASQDELFLEAVEIIRIILRRVLREAIATLKADKIVTDTDKGDEILVLETGCPWHNAVVRDLPHVRLVVLPGSKGEWMVCPVPVKVGVSVYRLPLPDSWKGKKAAELCGLAGVEGLKLCTASAHVVFTFNREAAEALAKKLVS